jgi:TonB family protein
MFMAFLGFAIYLESADWPVEQSIAAIPEDFSDVIFEEPPVPEERIEENVVHDGREDVDEQPRPAPSPNVPPRHAGRDRDGETPLSADDRARIIADAGQQVEALLLGSLGEQSGALDDVLAGGAVTGSAEDVLAQAEGVGVATANHGTLRVRGGGNSGQVDGLGGLVARGTDSAQENIGTSAVSERPVQGNVRLDPGDDVGGTGDFDQRLVSEMIRRRQSAFRGCYETRLREDRDLAGKVTVQFSIQESGSVTGARATENTSRDAALASCVVDVVGRLRFHPGPEGGSVTFAYPFVFAPQN